MEEIQWLPTVYCYTPFQPPLAYVNHIIALFAGRLQGNIKKSAGGKNVKTSKNFGIRQFMRSLSVTSAKTTNFVRKIKTNSLLTQCLIDPVCEIFL
jgi:hypothetical protein